MPTSNINSMISSFTNSANGRSATNSRSSINRNTTTTTTKDTSSQTPPTKDRTVSTDGTGAIKNPLADGSSRGVGQDLDKDAFLKLLLTQLQNQNPLEPMENTDFIAQMAQFTSLEQMQNLNATMSNSQAFNLVGKDVIATVRDEVKGTYSTVTGTVSHVNIKNRVPYLVVNDKEISFSDVEKVINGNSMNNIESSLVTSQTMALIGKNIQAIMSGEDGKSTYVEGKVDFVKFVNGTPILSVNGKEIFPYEVVSVAEEGLLIGKEVSAVVDGNTITGKITGVSIKDKDVYATIDGNEVQVTDINSMITAISLIGKSVDSEKVSGIVSGVLIKEKIPYIVVDGKEYQISDIY